MVPVVYKHMTLSESQSIQSNIHLYILFIKLPFTLLVKVKFLVYLGCKWLQYV